MRLTARARDLAVWLVVPVVFRFLEELDEALWEGGEDADAASPARPDALTGLGEQARADVAVSA